MANNKMLIDAAHPEETRVVMVRGNRVDEFDFESEHKTQLRGNIYLAKVTRVEPSLQAAFVDYGGNRHGFLAFSEIHPDYYQIPVADRQALLDAEAEDARVAAAEEAEADAKDDEGDAVETSEEKQPRKRRSRRRGGKKASAETEESTESSEDDAENQTPVEAQAAESDDSADAGDAEENDDDSTTMAAENDGDDVVSEPASAEPAKKPRRRTSRKKAKPEAEVEVSSEAESPAPTEEEAPKKAPRRRTSRKKVVAEESATDQPAEVTTETAVEAEPVAEEKPKKTRRRTSRAKKADDSEDSKTEAPDTDTSEATEAATEPDTEAKEDNGKRPRSRSRSRRRKKNDHDNNSTDNESENGESVEDLGSDDALEEVPARRAPRRHYKIQEVIKRRQILLVQVVKEERGNKGAALTTYLSLAGRYSVLMPNTARGGGISRKITNASDRKRLKSVANGLDVPQGMGVILRTAGASRKPEDIQRDFEYLMRLWENVRTLTLESTAPCLVYEEGSLIKRSIRDLYDADTGEIMVAGEAGHREAKDFMTMLTPNQAKNVKLYRDRIPMFARMGVESQLDAMLQPQVTLKSGGYLIIDQTEALVAIDVNSGRSTRQHSIEDTAAQTNLEAADEVARQLRLRDLAGLIVIDFIDMEDKRNIRNVEKRLKDALKNDRARIQVGRISHFGLMEMSRQRIRASVLESTTQVCPTCEGLGHVRAASSVVLAVLRSIEEHLNRNSRNDLTVKVSTPTALYLLNNKRDNLGDLESRFGVSISIATADDIGTVPCIIEKGDLSNRSPIEAAVVSPDTFVDESNDEQDAATTVNSDAQQADAPHGSQNQENGNGEGKKRRRRRRKRKNTDVEATEESLVETKTEDEATPQSETPVDSGAAPEAVEEKPKRRSRRSKKTVEENEPTTDVSSEAPAEEEKKPKTRRTRAKKAAAPEAADETATIQAESAVENTSEENSDATSPKRRTTRRKKEDAVVAEAASADVVSERVEASAETKSDDAAPKKAGWWQRKFF